MSLGDKHKPMGRAIQAHGSVSDSGGGSFRPFTNVRVMLPPPMKQRISRKYYELGHGIRRIGRAERLPERVIEQVTRETYWDTKPSGSVKVAA
jgi:hypothetical protein